MRMASERVVCGGRLAAGPDRWTVTAAMLVLQLLLTPTWGNDLANFMDMEEYEPDDDPAAPYGTVWYNGSYLYLPAPPGKTPSCARGGMTYCNTIHTYPDAVIEKLLVRWKYDLSTVFSSENRDTLTSALARNSSRGTTPRWQRPHKYLGSYRPPSQPAFRPTQGHRGRPLGFDAAVTSAGDSTNQGGYLQLGGAGFVYSVPSTRQQPPRPHSGYIRRPPYNPVNWAYSFSVPRQKRQADGGGSQLCPTSGQFVMPRAGLNNRGEWRFVINMGELDEQYTQLVRSERCISTQCSGLCTIPSGMTATCQQQYVQKKMVGLDPGGSQMYTDLYWIPHCCVCQIR